MKMEYPKLGQMWDVESEIRSEVRRKSRRKKVAPSYGKKREKDMRVRLEGVITLSLTPQPEKLLMDGWLEGVEEGREQSSVW